MRIRRFNIMSVRDWKNTYDLSKRAHKDEKSGRLSKIGMHPFQRAVQVSLFSRKKFYLYHYWMRHIRFLNKRRLKRDIIKHVKNDAFRIVKYVMRERKVKTREEALRIIISDAEEIQKKVAKVQRILNTERAKPENFSGEFANLHHAAMGIFTGLNYIQDIRIWLKEYLK